MVEYELNDRVATITMDDGRANALSPALQEAVHVALDRADADGAVVVLAGRDGRFSAGFDLDVLAGGGTAAVDMVIGGFELALRLLETPRPVVMACTGHAIAMGAFLLLAGDYRVGAAGPFRIVANEVALGTTMPHAPIELMRLRLHPSAVQRSAVLAEEFDPIGAASVGYVDHIVDPDRVLDDARSAARTFCALDARAHARTKERVRGPSVDAMRVAIEHDRAELTSLLG